MSNPNLFKYLSHGKWYTFDLSKTKYTPEQFKALTNSERMKIIGSHVNDNGSSTYTLKTKTEAKNKLARQSDYLEKRNEILKKLLTNSANPLFAGDDELKTALEEVCKEEKDKRAEAETLKQAILDEINGLNKDIDETVSKANIDEDEKNKLTNDINEAVSKLNIDEDEKNKLTNDINELYNKDLKFDDIEKYYDAVESILTNNLMINTRLMELNPEIHQLKDKIKSSQTDLASKYEQLNQLKDKIKQSKTDLASKYEQLKQLNDEIRNYNQAIEAARERTYQEFLSGTYKHQSKEQKEKYDKAIKEAQAKLKQLDIDYADIVNINTANTLNITDAKDLTIKNAQNIQGLKDNVQKALDESKITKSIESRLKDIISASHSIDDIKTNSSAIKEAIESININDKITSELSKLLPAVKEAISSAVKEIKLPNELVKKINQAAESSQSIDDLIEKLNNLDIAEKMVSEVVGKLENYDLVKIAQKCYEYFDKDVVSKALKAYEDDKVVKSALNNIEFLSMIKSEDNEYRYKNIDEFKHAYQNYSTFKEMGSYRYLIMNDKDKVYPTILNLNPTGNEDKKPKLTRLSANPILVRHHNKQNEIPPRGTDYKYYLRVDDIRGQEPKAEGLIETYDQTKFRNLIKLVESLGDRIDKLEGKTKTEDKLVRPKTFDFSNVQLKHIEPDRRQSEQKPSDLVTQLNDVMNKRRQDIEPDEDESRSEEEEWGDGIVKSRDTVGGLLEELKEDLNKYGIVFSLSDDGKAYFLNVYPKRKTSKRYGSGVEEAEAIRAEHPVTYGELRDIYEKLY